MENELNTKKNGNQAMLKICGFIVDKRNLFFLLFGLLIIFSAISRNWVQVENSMAHYLPGTTETKQGLDLMAEEFITYGTCNVMIANVSYEQAEHIDGRLEQAAGVFSVDFDDTEEHYTNGSAYYNITFDYDENDEACLTALDGVKEVLGGYDYYLTTSLGDTQSELIGQEMNTITVLVAIIVVSVLLLTTQAYAEIPVLLITFLSAAILNMGTNFLLGTISFVSDSVTIVLQLALSVDYAVILLNRYKEEHATLEAREAVIVALSKAIPEIAGSSLTTIGGLIAMTFMQYKMGPDMGVVLIKAILLSLCAVFLLMPGVIMLFSNLMEKTKHKNFIPDIPLVGKFAYASRYIVAPLFVAAIIAAYMISKGCPYVFGYSTVTPPLQNSVQKAEEMQETNFGGSNMVALIVPAGSYENEKALLRDLDACPEVDYTMGLANIEAMDGYKLTDKLTPRQFSELIDLDYEVAELVYAAYAVNDEDYAKVVNGLSEYQVPLLDMFMFVYEEVEQGYVTLEDDLQETLDDAYRQMNFARNQLQGENYSRMLVYLTLPEESEETFAFLDKMHEIAGRYYSGTVLVCGESVSQYDLQKTFSRDNIVVNVVSILVVLVVLLFTFKSAGMPVLLIAVIQGSIWINFSVPALQHDNLFFMGYLIVSSIQMGANIDYAIVIASRYTELRKETGRKKSIIDTMNQSFPTIVTSGTMLAISGILIGKMTSDVAIFGIGKCLGRGTLISIFITMFVLPQILLVGDTIIEKTAFVMNMPIHTRNATGLIKVDGLVRGKIDGTVTGTMNAIIRGNVSAYVEAGDVTELTEEEYKELCDTMAEEDAEKATVEQEGGTEDEITSVEDANKTLDSYDDEETEWEEIYIDSVDDLKKFSRDCWLDTWSQNKKIYLTQDLNLAGSDFVSIPTFGGYFDGQGHTISGLTVRDAISYTGLFCYTQEKAVIANLNVAGTVRPSGNQMVVGGIVGDNSGIIIHCTFEGTVEGTDYVGGITGFNEQSGVIMDCVDSGKVTGSHYTGGIAGENTGNIVGCTNEAEVNTSNEDKAMSLEDINLAQYVGLMDIGSSDEEAEKEAAVINNTIDSGGIAGLSTGIIQFCNNNGKVGYEHVGYNTGGIVGRQSGYVYACENTGTVYGRKDVGGIAGQTEPYIAIDLSEDIVYQLAENIDKMHDLTGHMLNDAGSESDTLSARLTIVQDFVDKALEDTSFLTDRTVGWTDEMIGSVNEAVNRFDYVMDETAKDDGVLDHASDAAGNVKDAAGKLQDTVESLDIYQYMSAEQRNMYDNAKANMENATKKYSEDYADAVAAYNNYYIAYIASQDPYQNEAINEQDLRPKSKSDKTVNIDWTISYDWKDYIQYQGWVHYVDADNIPDFPQPGGTEQGDLDQQLLRDVAQEMADDANIIEANASAYAKDQYQQTHNASYESDMRGYLQTMADIIMSVQGEMTQEAAAQLSGAVGYVRDASDNLETAGNQAKNIFDTLNDMPDIALPQLGDDYRSKTNSLTANLQGLSENMGYLNGEMASTNDVLIGDLEDINDQFSTIMKLYTDAIDGVLDMDYTSSYEDTSQEDAETSTDATVADCRNTGTVQGDINVAGIVGTMAIEYDFDLEGDVTGIEDARMNSTFLTKCVLRQNINQGKIAAQKNCAGGISGLQEMGTILRCENYGRITGSAGNYVGGVTGQSLSDITNCYAKCTVSGEEYVAGIAGSGSGINGCCAIVRI